MDIRNCMIGGKPEDRLLWNSICDDMESEKAKWVSELRKSGFKAAHPNDGWVDREKKELHFAYPHFNDGAGVGDLVMLGWATGNKYLRPVRLTGRRESMSGLVWWSFDDLT